MKTVARRSLWLIAPLAALALLVGPASAAPLPPQIHTVSGGGSCTFVSGNLLVNGQPVPITEPCDNTAATSVPIEGARSVAALPGGGFVYVDYGYNLVREVSPSGTVTTVAGNGTTADVDGGLAVNSGLDGPVAVAPLPSGGFLITEYNGSVVRMVSPGPPGIATITTIAGVPVTVATDPVSGAVTTTAHPGKGPGQLNYPSDAEPTADGHALIADTYNNLIREVSLADGSVATVGGGGSCNDATTGCDGSPASAVRLNHPDSVSPIQGGAGGYLVAEYDISTIRSISATAPSGTFTTVAGTGTPGYSGDGGPATGAQLNRPQQVTSTGDGGILIADTNNERVRQISPSGTITTVAGNGVQTDAGDGGNATSASLAGPASVSPTGDGGFFVAEQGGGLIRQITIPPVSQFTSSPAAPDGTNGWFIHSTIHVTVTSATATTTRCELDPTAPPPVYDAMPSVPCPYTGGGGDLTGDGTHTIYAASVNAAGDKELPVSVTVKLDGPAPTVTCSTTPSFLVGAPGASVTATVSDSVSGPLAPTVTIPVKTGVIGSRTANVTGTNNAGNSTVEHCQYNVLAMTLSPTPVLLWAFSPGPTSSGVKQLRVTHVPPHAAVNVTCSGQGCPFRTARSVMPKKKCDKRCKAALGRTHAIDLARLFAGSQLAVGARLTVSVTKPRTIGRTILFTVRGGQDPSDRVACLKPGVAVPTARAERSCSP